MKYTKQLKNKVSYNGRMKKMNNETYALRRKVMDVIYQIKRRGYEIPRIEVRIVEDVDACAYAYVGQNIVHVNDSYMTKKYDPLFTQIVLHEVVHAVFGVREVKGCKLMHCSKFWKNRPTESKAWKLFDKYYKNYKK